MSDFKNLSVILTSLFIAFNISSLIFIFVTSPVMDIKQALIIRVVVYLFLSLTIYLSVRFLFKIFKK